MAASAASWCRRTESSPSEMAAPFQDRAPPAAMSSWWNGRGSGTDGAAISEGELSVRLHQRAPDAAMPELRLNAAGEARYEQVDRLLARIRLAGVQQLGFVGNERYRGAF